MKTPTGLQRTTISGGTSQRSTKLNLSETMSVENKLLTYTNLGQVFFTSENLKLASQIGAEQQLFLVSPTGERIRLSDCDLQDGQIALNLIASNNI